MEPGFLKPGNFGDDARWGSEGSITSMEPGFLKPGNDPVSLSEVVNPQTLQWSRAS